MKVKTIKQSIRKLVAFSLAATLTLSGIVPLGDSAAEKVYAQDESEKIVTGLGVSSLTNPNNGSGGWCKVYFGSNDSNPLRFNVLNTHETVFGSDTTLFLDCDTVPFRSKASCGWDYRWSKSNSRSSLDSFMSKKLSQADQAAVYSSTKTEPAEGDVYDIMESFYPTAHRYSFEPLKDDKYFCLDACEIMNPNYGFRNKDDSSDTRKKSNTDYWLRSGNERYTDTITYVDTKGEPRWDEDAFRDSSVRGLSPALNISHKKILFTTLISGTKGAAGAEYKLTLIDEKARYSKEPFKFEITGEITRVGNQITIPYKLSGTRAGNATQISALVTDKKWNEEGAKILKYGKLDITSGKVASSGTGTFELPEGCEGQGQGSSGYYVYIFAEDINGGKMTDYASNLVNADVPSAGLAALATSYEGVYDGKMHGISMKVFPINATVMYGTAEGTYDLTTCPTYKDAGDYTIYYKVTSDDFPGEEVTDYATIRISKRPLKISGITVEDKTYDGTSTATLVTDSMIVEGKVNGDDLVVTPSGLFSDKKAGEDKTVYLNYALSGTTADNYVLNPTTCQLTTTATINKQAVTVSGIMAYNKVYDHSDVAELDYSQMVIDGKVPGDDLSATATGSFHSASTEDTNQTVYIKDLTLAGYDKDNYCLAAEGQQTETTAIIYNTGFPRITVAGWHYIYDGNEHEFVVNAESTVENPTKSVEVYYSESASYPSADTARPKSTRVCDKNIYYWVNDPNSSFPTIGPNESKFVVAQRPITVSALTGDGDVYEKVYDGTINAPDLSFNNAVYDYTGDDTSLVDGRIGDDDISITAGTAVFADPNVGDDKTILLSGLTLGGKSANQYTLSPNAEVTGRITKRPIIVSGVTASDKFYDETTKAEINTEDMEIMNLVPGDDVTVVVTGTFEDANAGEDKVVNLSYELTGESAGNYEILLNDSQATATATIFQTEPEIVESDSDTIYDGEEHSATASPVKDIDASITYVDEDGNETVTSPKYRDVGVHAIIYNVLSSDSNYYDRDGMLWVIITPRPLVITGVEAKDKNYDGKTDAQPATDKMKISNLIDGDDVVVNVKASFENSEAGNDKTVVLSYELSGKDAYNYRIDQENSQAVTSASIISSESDDDTKPEDYSKKTGWITDETGTHYIKEDGSKASNEWIDGKWLDEKGNQSYKPLGKWKLSSTGWWFEDESGWYPHGQWQHIDNKWYYFTEDGYMDYGEYRDGYWLGDDGAWDEQYFLTWKSNSVGWWVEDISGWWPASQWLKIDGYWYYFDASGYMVTNQYVDGYWIGADGVCW